MTTMTLQDVSAWTARESFFLYLVGATKAAYRNLAFWILAPLFLLMTAILAQTFPFSVRKTMRRINSALPCVQDSDVLMLVRDMYQLTESAGAFYSRFCLFRETMRQTLDELDDSVESLNLVLDSKNELRDFLESAEAKRSPDLPLQFEKVG